LLQNFYRLFSTQFVVTVANCVILLSAFTRSTALNIKDYISLYNSAGLMSRDSEGTTTESTGKGSFLPHSCRLTTLLQSSDGHKLFILSLTLTNINCFQLVKLMV